MVDIVALNGVRSGEHQSTCDNFVFVWIRDVFDSTTGYMDVVSSTNMESKVLIGDKHNKLYGR